MQFIKSVHIFYVEIYIYFLFNKVIPNMKGSANEIERITLRWKETKVELHATQLLLDIHNLLNESQSSLLSNDLYSAVSNLNKVINLIVNDLFLNSFSCL